MSRGSITTGRQMNITVPPRHLTPIILATSTEFVSNRVAFFNGPRTKLSSDIKPNSHWPKSVIMMPTVDASRSTLELFHDAPTWGARARSTCIHLPLGQCHTKREVDISSMSRRLNVGLALGCAHVEALNVRAWRTLGDSIRNSGFCSSMISSALSLQCFRLKSHMYPSLAGTVKSSDTPPRMPIFRSILTTQGGL